MVQTLIVIAHRLSTVTDADRIVVVSDGRIEAAGDPRRVRAVGSIARYLAHIGDVATWPTWSTGLDESGARDGADEARTS